MQQDAGGQEADHGAAGRDSDPRPDGFPALLGREDGRDHRERDRHDQGGGDAHHRADRDQGARRIDEERENRDGTEQREPDCQQRLPAVAVADRARRQEEGGEHDRVGVDDPLQLRLRRAGVTRDLGEGDVEAGDGRDDHHQREAHDAKHRRAMVRLGLEGHGRSHSRLLTLRLQPAVEELRDAALVLRRLCLRAADVPRARHLPDRLVSARGCVEGIRLAGRSAGWPCSP